MFHTLRLLDLYFHIDVFVAYPRFSHNGLPVTLTFCSINKLRFNCCCLFFVAHLHEQRPIPRTFQNHIRTCDIIDPVATLFPNLHFPARGQLLSHLTTVICIDVSHADSVRRNDYDLLLEKIESRKNSVLFGGHH